MRRDGLYRTARTLRHCCAGLYHRLPCREEPSPGASSEGEEADTAPIAVPAAPKQVPGCCGHTGRAGDRHCYGHNYSHIARCGQCKAGRRQGPGGAKARKKIGGRYVGSAREQWLQVVREAREAEVAAHQKLPLPDFTGRPCMGRGPSVAAAPWKADAPDSVESLAHDIPSVLPAPPPPPPPMRPMRPRRGARFSAEACRCCNPAGRSFGAGRLAEDGWILL
mmetsp:Transcript_9335/g.24082  ORF Transcript_9335/g.24082 Transcript_9335/m.24082 type:complete len:222 (+) Transcript_9335:110-775(+)